MKNLYEILRVHSGASAAEIKKSYRNLSKQYHPDLNPGNQAAEVRFKEINEAYAVLSNPQSRAEYDKKMGATATAGEGRQAAAKAEEPRRDNSTAGFNPGDVNLQFERFFGFDPQSKVMKEHFGGKKRGAGDNPLDTSHIFASFFNPKKK
ncbi:Hypothetical protein LUCI_4305 [Lucifera butyrica]|uniref:J domain-containing protein n=1 Tax=Lucifera butyrica TaxID=1351585 RepID=A0A498RCN4_9FIRM|nr:DnaJ domain-containing protein [Lucifera butyrica]VBB09019.1 Hypothetical protein LUCI_4305 [Lucifera butyrica]